MLSLEVQVGFKPLRLLRASSGVGCRARPSEEKHIRFRRAKRLLFNFWDKKVDLSSLLFINLTAAATDLHCRVFTHCDVDGWLELEEKWREREIERESCMTTGRWSCSQTCNHHWLKNAKMFTDEEMLQSYIHVKFSLVRRDWQPNETQSLPWRLPLGLTLFDMYNKGADVHVRYIHTYYT